MSTHNTVKVWDLPVRVFHWSLVVSFVITYLSGDELDTLHAWFGYIVAALITFRVVYGFVGSKYARFSDFVSTPKQVLAYLKSLLTTAPKYYLGHNPAGGWMVIALLISLALSTWTGLEAYAVEGHGPLAATNDISFISTAYADSDDDDEHDEHEGKANKMDKEGEEDEFWEELHEFSVNLTLLLVLVHIAGVLVTSYIHKENLAKAMINGNKSSKL